jgi:hypothetical protein
MTLFCPVHTLVALQSRQRDFRLERRAMVRLGRLGIFAPSSRHAAGPGAENPPNSTVQICRATSKAHGGTTSCCKDLVRRSGQPHISDKIQCFIARIGLKE